MQEEILSRRWTDQALFILSPALDRHITKIIAELIGPDVPWTYVLQELDHMKGKIPQDLSRRDPAIQFRMITERLGDLGYPFDRENRNRLFSTYGQMLRLARNQLSHPDEAIEPVHAMTTIMTAIQLASLLEASETVEQLTELQDEVLEYLWSGQEDDEEEPAEPALPRSQPKTNAPTEDSAPREDHVNKRTGMANARGSLSKRIVDWEPISISPIGEKDDLNNLRRVSSKRKVLQAIETVVDNFGPVSEDQLLTSVARAFGLKRKSTPFQKKIKHQINCGNASVWRDQDGFYWPNGVNPVKWRIYRRDAHGRRLLQNISPHELVNLIEIIICNKPGQLTKRSLLHEVRDEFGLKRLGGPAREQVDKAIHRGIDHDTFTIYSTEKFVPIDTTSTAVQHENAECWDHFPGTTTGAAFESTK